MNTETDISTLFVVPRYWPNMGGSEQHTRKLAQLLSTTQRVGVVRHASIEAGNLEQALCHNAAEELSDNDVSIFQVAAGDSGASLMRRLSKYYAHYRMIRPLYDYLARNFIKDNLRDTASQYQIIHAVYNGLTASAEASADIAEEQNVPFIFTPLAHTTLPQGTGWSSARLRRLYKRADVLIAMTEYERQWLAEQGADINKTFVCPVSTLIESSSDSEGFRQRHALGEHPVVLFLGRMEPHKGYEQILKAAKKVWLSEPETRFLFLGPATSESEAIFSEYNDPRIVNLGLISQEEKTSALSACTVLCVPSTEESLGVIYLEAWSFGKPVIAADIPVLRSVIEHGVNGLLIRPDPEALQEAVLQILGDPALAKSLGQAGLIRVQERYNWDIIASQLQAIYRDALE